MDSSSNVVVIVRSAGERTIALCQSLLCQQMDKRLLKVVAERPFAVAQEKSMCLALDEGQDWTIFVDADVLLTKNALGMITDELTTRTESFYMLNFLVLDRGFGGPVYAGVHAYRTSLLQTAMKFIKLAYQDQRPETRLCKEMAKLGSPTALSTSIVGLHDYEQYYRDLYRKMFVRAVKYKTLAESMKQIFTVHYATDLEDKVMMWGLMDGLFYYHAGNLSAPLDINFYFDRSKRVLDMLEVSEKEPLPENFEMDPQQTLETFTPGILYESVRSSLLPEKQLIYYGHDKASLSSYLTGIKKFLLNFRDRFVDT